MLLRSRGIFLASRAPWLALFLAASLGCDGTGSGGTDGSTANDGLVKSFARVDDAGVVQGVGVVVPVASLENVPPNDPAFQGDVGLEMPAVARGKIFIQLLRINYYSSGHGPAPYGQTHFDLHFFRGSKDEVSAIGCADTTPFSPDILAVGYEPPSTCVGGMGYHAWPSADIDNQTFTASIILGYVPQKMVFIEPMITKDVFLARKSFELGITRPASAGGTTTLFPSHLSATYDAASDAYTLEFNQLGTID